MIVRDATPQRDKTFVVELNATEAYHVIFYLADARKNDATIDALCTGLEKVRGDIKVTTR